MAWVRLDDQAPRNLKIVKAGPAAAWFWVCAIAHCQSQLTDGFISDLLLDQIGVKGAPRCHRFASVLVQVGLFDVADGGYRVHDYHDFNETKEEALERKIQLHDDRVRAGRAGGLASGEARSNKAKLKQVVEAKRSPDPTRPFKEPPNPLSAKGGRRTRRERKALGPDYDAFVWNCTHTPRCGNRTTCAVVSARPA